MHSVISCPQCQARLRVPADNPRGLVKCGVCGWQFSTGPEQAIEAIVVEEEPRAQPAQTRVRPSEPAPLARRAGGTAALRTEEQPQAHHRTGCFLHGLALLPLGIAAAGIPLCRFGTGWIGAVVWATLGVGLALICLNLVRRTQWSWVGRLLGSLGLTGGGYFLLLIALAVSFWQWWHAIDPADWRDFAPEGGRFHVSVPGTPLAQAATPGSPINIHTYALELHRQDVAFAISYGDVPLQEWRQLPFQVHFDNARDGMIAQMPGSRVVAEKRIPLKQNPGREYHLDVAGKGMMVARVYFVRNRLFVLLIGGSRLKPDSEEVSKFLDSFQPDPLDEKVFPPLRRIDQPPDLEDEDIYPGRKILGHEKHPVRRLVVSRDGSTLAAGCEDNTIELWDLGSGEGRGKLILQPGFDRPFFRPDFDLSPDGKIVAAAVPGGGFKLFDTTTQKEIATLIAGKNPDEAAMLNAQGVGTGEVSAIAFSPGGRYLAGNYTAGGRLEIRVWDVPARKLLRSIPGYKGLGSVMAFTPDGHYLVNGGEDGVIRWLDPLTGCEVKHFTLLGDKPGQNSPVTALAFTADGGTLAVSYWHVLHLLDVRRGTSRVVLQHGGAFVAMDISANGGFLVTGTSNGELRISETAAGKQRWIQPGFDLGRVEPAQALAFTPDGKHLVLYRGQRLEVWDLDQMIQATPEELAEPKERPAVEEPEPSSSDRVTRIAAHVGKDGKAPHGVIAMARSADGKTLLTAGRDRSLRFWDLASGKKQAEEAVGADVVDVAVSSDGRTVAVAVSSAVYLYDAKTAKKVDTLTPDAAAITEATMGPQLRDILKKRNNGKLLAPPPGAVTIYALAFAPDGKTLAVTCTGVIELWDVAAKKVLRRVVLKGGAGRMVFAPDGRTLATCIGDWMANDPLVWLYDVPAGKLLARLSGFKGSVNAVAYSADGKYLAAAGGGPDRNQMVLVWDANTGQELKRFLQPQQYNQSLAFSPDGKTLAWGQGVAVHVCDVASEQRIGTFSVGVACLLFSRDNHTLMAGSGTGDVELWNVARLPRPKPPAVADKPPARPLASGKDLQRIGNVEPFLTAAVAPQAGRALFLGRDRFLRVYSYPDFKPERAYWLGVTAYRAALDCQRGMLYAAVCDVQALDYRLPDPAGGPADLHVYDVKKILAGEKLSDHVLRPAAVVPLKAKVADLLCTPDHRWIYYQTIDAQYHAHLGRIDARTRTKEQEKEGGGLCCGPDGKTLYVGRGNTIHLLDAATMAERGSIEVPMKAAEVAINDDLLFVNDGRTLGVLDLRPAKPVFLGNWGNFVCPRLQVGIAPRRAYIVESSSIPTTIQAFEFPEKAAMAKHEWPGVDSIAEGDGSLLGEWSPTPDGKYLLCRTGTVLRLALPGINRLLPEPAERAQPAAPAKGSPWRERPPLPAPKNSFFHALALSPDGRRLAAGGTGGSVSLYDRDSGRLLRQLDGGSRAGIGYLTFSPDGKTLTCTSLDRKAQVLLLSHGGPVSYIWNLSGYGLDAVAYTPDSAEVAMAGEAPRRGNINPPQGKEIVFWRAKQSEVAKHAHDFRDPLTAVAVSPDGKRVAAGSITGPVYSVNLAKPRESLILLGHGAEVRCVAFSPDGKTLASAGVDGTVRQWDPVADKQLWSMPGHKHVVLCLAFSPNGKMLVSGGADGSLRLWEAATGKERGVIPPRRPGTMVYALAFAPDGKTLAAACGDEVRQWDVAE